MNKTSNLFDNKVLCKNCNKEMKKKIIAKHGFEIRVLECLDCGNKIIHPGDEEEYKKYEGLRNKTYKVKLRVVGNSYAVSIPKEIVNFMREQERMMDDMVRLCFDDMSKLKLMFKKKSMKNGK